jgi:hypothetical protein
MAKKKVTASPAAPEYLTSEQSSFRAALQGLLLARWDPSAIVSEDCFWRPGFL